MKKLICILFLYSGCTFASSFDQSLQYKRIGDIAISPDGKKIAYTVSQIQTDGSLYKRYYFLQLSEQNKIILKGQYISQPTWSPDGKKLAYFEKKDDEQFIKIYDMLTKQHKSFVSFTKRNIYAFKWSPNGKMIAFVADNEKKETKLPATIDRDYVNSRIFIKEFSEKNMPIQALTSNDESITQMFTSTLDGGFSWSDDSKSIAYAHQKKAGANESISSEISIISISTRAITEIPFMKKHTANQPHYSPNGQWLGFIANIPNSKNTFYNSIGYNMQVCVTNTKTLATYCLTNTPNQSSSIIGWSAANDVLYVLDWYKTKGPQIYAINLDATIPVKLISEVDGFIEPLTVTLNSTNNFFGFGYETENQAPEIVQTKITPFKLIQVTHIQRPVSESLGTIETIQWPSRDHFTIEGVLIKPPHFDPQKKYPLLVEVHGGPTGAFAKRFLGGCDEFGDMIIPICVKNVLDLGFIILQPNYRGSSGYGIDFRAANVGDLGGGDYADIMSGVDYLIHDGIVDSNHLAIYGWSYGGYMTSWAVTQSTRFKTAIAGAGLTDFVSFTGTSDIPRYLQTYLATDLWNNNALYIQRSPIFFSKNVNTPLLILHGKDDVRVPVTQSYEFYNSLKLQDKLVEMVTFPGQGHVLTDGSMIVTANMMTNKWLKKALE